MKERKERGRRKEGERERERERRREGERKREEGERRKKERVGGKEKAYVCLKIYFLHQ